MPSGNTFYRDIGAVLFWGILTAICFGFAGWMAYLALR